MRSNILIPILLLFLAIAILFIPVLFGADETFLGTHGYIKVLEAGQAQYLRNNISTEEKKVNGTDFFVSLLYTDNGETWPDVDVHELGEEIRGQVLYPKRQPRDPLTDDVEWNIDDAMDDNSKFTGLVSAQWKGVISRLFVLPQAGPLSIEEGQYFVAGGEGKAKIEENGKHGQVTEIDYYVDGNILIATGVAKFVAMADGIISGANMTAAVDGDDGSVLADINIGGTTIFTNQALRPTIISTDGNDFLDITTLADCVAGAVHKFVKGDIITVDFDDDGGTTPAVDVKLQVFVNYGKRIAVAAEEFTGDATDEKIASMELI